MSLYQVLLNQIIEPQDINQLVNILMQPSGGVETGHYRLAGSAHASGDVISTWINTLSRGSSPVSVTIDTADAAPSGGLNAPAAPFANANAGGFLIFATTTGAGNNFFCAGNWTVHY